MSDEGLSIFDEPDDANAADEEPTRAIETQKPKAEGPGRANAAKPSAKPAAPSSAGAAATPAAAVEATTTQSVPVVPPTTSRPPVRPSGTLVTGPATPATPATAAP